MGQCALFPQIVRPFVGEIRVSTAAIAAPQNASLSYDRIVDIDVGTVIAGKYELVRLLGKGAMGEVWLATHNSLGGEFAVKLVETTDDIEAETAAGRFQLEAQIAAKLSRRTRHIVSVSDHGEEGGMAYLVMELLEGESLEARVKRGGRLDLPETAAIVMQVARALSIAHDEGIFHRDLKPANIFLAKDEDGRLLVKLLDFGIARAVKPFKTRSPFATSKDMVLGTPSYMSPEQARGLDTLDHRCDLWALATCAYEALAKRIPFEGETVEDIFLSICTFRVVPLHTLRPDLAPEVEAFFAKAFASKLDDRFSNAQQIADAFENLVDPTALEQFFGIPGLTPSGRRLPVAPISSPEPVAGANAAAATEQPVVVSKTSTAKLPKPDPNASSEKPRLALVESGGVPAASSDPMGASIDTLAGIPKKKSGLLIGGAAIAAIAVALLAVFAFRGGGPKSANAAQGEGSSAPSAKVADRNEVPPPPSTTVSVATNQAPVPSPTLSAAPVDPHSSATVTSVGLKKQPSRPGATGGHTTAAGGHPTTASPPTTTPPTPPPTATSQATPPKKGPHDKGEVF
jgi:eukaryotic-like serine/threonine-protein kinase